MYIGITLDNYDKGKATKHLQFVIDGLKKYKLKTGFLDIDQIEKLNKNDIPIIYGLIRGSDMALKYCWEHNINYLYLDNSYFNDLTSKMFRLIPNGCHPTKQLMQIDSPRFEIKYKKTQNKNGYILVIPPSDTVQKLFKREDWLSNTKSILKKSTNREIIVRTKPEALIMKTKDGKLVKESCIKSHNIPLKEHLKNAYCVVADTSGVAVLALIDGLPVITNETGPVGKFVENDISNVNSVSIPSDKEVKHIINQLTHYCYTKDELKSGEFYKHMNDLNLWDFK